MAFGFVRAYKERECIALCIMTYKWVAIDVFIMMLVTLPPLSFVQAVYGVLSSIEGYDSFKDMLQHTQIGPWYFATQKLVEEHKAASGGTL